MGISMRAVAVLACIALGFLRGSSFLRAEPPAAAETPERLVRAALESELKGLTERRAQLLGEALHLDPDYAPARWHSGFVRIGQEWIRIDDVPKRTASDPQLAAYRERRDALIDTSDNHRQLARWCRKNRLTDEERVHWAKVLEFDQQDAEALAALGLQVYEGRMMTRSQIERAKVAAGQRLAAMRRWQPQLLKCRRAIEGNNAEARERALKTLDAFDEPAAIELVEGIFGVGGQRQHALELNGLLIDVLARIPGRDATETLIRRAILSDLKESRMAAAGALRKRPASTFVPQLIRLLPPNESIQTRHRIYLTLSRNAPLGSVDMGGVIREHELVVRDRDTGKVRSYFLRDEDYRGESDGTPLFLRVNRRASRHYATVAAWERQLDALRKNRQQMRDRVQQALVESTGFEAAGSAEGWLGQFNDYYETYSPPRIPTAIQPESAHYEFHQVRTTYSCFPEGTPIETLTGPVAIETVKPGDRVLSQNPETGELAFKTIQAVTLRPPAPLVEIGIGSETIRATRGHPFWVNGEGWRMAKYLSAGATLHAIGGAVTVDKVAEVRAKEAYNLVVSDFGTYFVGDSQVLVHDNLQLAETTVPVPGLSRRTDVPKASPVTIR